MQINLDGLPEEVAKVLQDETVKQRILEAAEQREQPLVQKKNELLGKVTEYNATLSKIKELGGIEALTSAAQARAEAEAARKAAEIAEAEKSGNAEKLKSYYGEQLAARDKELNDLRQSILSEKVSSRLSKAIRDAKGVPELLEPHLRGRVKAEMVDGEVKMTVLTANGLPLLNADGKEASLADLIQEFRNTPTFGRAFDAPAVSGAGTRQSGDRPSTNPWNPNTKNITEQMRIYRQDPALAKRMAAEHGVQLS